MSEYESSPSESTEQEDWVAGGSLRAQLEGASFFAGQSIPIDTSRLPEPPPDLVA